MLTDTLIIYKNIIYEMLYNYNINLFQIMGTITTYFLILVQLGSSPDDLEKSTNVTIPLNNTRKI